MKFTVLGGGISGLTAAHYLTKLGIRPEHVRVLEASERLGGWIQTTRHDDGVLHEHGPRTIRPAGPAGANTLELVGELGLGDKITPIKRGHPATKNRLVLVDSELHALPSSLLSVLRHQKPFDRPLALSVLSDFWKPRKKCDDDSIYEFVKRRFGKDVADYAIDPLVRGICAGNARQISADSFVTTELFRYEQQYGGILKGVIKESLMSRKKKNDESSRHPLVARAREEHWNVWSVSGGLQTLVEALEKSLVERGVNIQKNVSINEINETSKGNTLQLRSNEEDFEQDFVISSLPAYQTAKLLKNIHPLKPAHNFLSAIPFVNVAVINIEFDENVLNRDPAFGFLVPSTQKEPLLGVIFDTCSFPQGNKTIFTVMMGGAWFESLFGDSPTQDALAKLAVQQLKTILKIDPFIFPKRISSKILRNCIAQYTIGHRSRVTGARKNIEDSKLPLAIVGSSYDGVGVNDAIMSSKNEIAKILEKIKKS